MFSTPFRRTFWCYAFTLSLALVSLISKAQDYDLVIRNGRIIDGTGNSWFRGDIAVLNGKIVTVGKVSGTARKILDAKNLIVAPGFIDVHGHVENGILSNPTSDNYIYDGVTSVVTGNCGGSADTLSVFFHAIDSMKVSINVASLVGHNTVRKLGIGLSNRAPTEDELKKMDRLVAEAMEQGAVGLSTGLIYLPGMYAKTDEVVALAKAAGRYGGVYASHIRNEENGVVDAINEAINIGKEAGIPVEISHFKVSGKANWGRSTQTLALIEKARSEGYDVTIDQYPYTASSTNLGIRLPDWALSGGQDSLKLRINDPIQHKMIVKEMLEQLKKFKYKDYSFAVVAMHAADTTLNGKSISEINLLKGRKSRVNEEAETVLDLMIAGGAQMVYHSMSEEDVKYFMHYPFNMIGADGGVIETGKGMPHPRGYGTNARVLGKYVREEKVVPLEEAIRRMTSLPAQKFHLSDRGLLLSGKAADMVIFDEHTVADKATFEKPHQFSEGFRYVIVNGAVVVDEGKHNGTRSGQILYGPGKK
jgi:N-acyl-D-amino-acid deacylase